MKKSVLIMAHLLFWVFTCLLVTLVFQIVFLAINLLEKPAPAISENFVFANLIALSFILPLGAVIFYTSYHTLKYFLKKTARFIWIGVGYVMFVIAVSIPGYWASQAAKQPDTGFLQILFSITLIVSPILYFNVCGFLFKAFIEWIYDRKIKTELENDKIKSQLELIKAKISPHFLFNTLNNIDILIQKDPIKASEYLNKLSDIMRFMLYETKEDKITLVKELSYIEKYIALQKIRTNNKNYIRYTVAGDPANLLVAPMVFIPFIENAFKHSDNKQIEDAIKINFNIEHGKIVFECENIQQLSNEYDDEYSGIGNDLVKRRLQLLYPNHHTFQVTEDNGHYKVTLTID